MSYKISTEDLIDQILLEATKINNPDAVAPSDPDMGVQASAFNNMIGQLRALINSHNKVVNDNIDLSKALDQSTAKYLKSYDSALIYKGRADSSDYPSAPTSTLNWTYLAMEANLWGTGCAIGDLLTCRNVSNGYSVEPLKEGGRISDRLYGSTQDYGESLMIEGNEEGITIGSATSTAPYIYQNQSELRGKLITKIRINITQAGTFTFYRCTDNGDGTFNPIFWRNYTLTSTGWQDIILNGVLGANESLGLFAVGDTAKFSWDYNRASNEVGGNVYLYNTGTGWDLLQGDLCVSVYAVDITEDGQLKSISDKYKQYTNNKIANIGVIPLLDSEVIISDDARRVITSPDGTAGFQEAFDKITYGGKIVVPIGEFLIDNAIVIRKRAINIEGAAWAYSTDPNGINKSEVGTNIVLNSATINGIALVSQTYENSTNGCRISEIGIQGSVIDGDTRGLYTLATYDENVGVIVSGARCDQVLFERINCCGLAAGIAVVNNPSFDASTIKDVNADGCNFGIALIGTAIYYIKVINCMLSDTTAYGFYANNGAFTLNGVIVDKCIFVRCAGGFTAQQNTDWGDQSAVYIAGNYCKLTNSLIEQAGQWRNVHGVEPLYQSSKGVIMIGDYNQVSENTIFDSQSNPIYFQGNYGKISGNLIKDNLPIILNGNNNTVVDNQIITTGDAIEVTGDANFIECSVVGMKVKIVSGTGNKLVGFDVSDITDNGTGTIII